MKKTTYVRIGAIYDLIVTIPFAIPGLMQASLATLRQWHTQGGFSGRFPSFEPAHELFVYLFGSIVTIWSLTRAFRPSVEKGWWDNVGRLAFSLSFSLAIVQGVSQTLVVFLILELTWFAFQTFGLTFGKKAPTESSR